PNAAERKLGGKTIVPDRTQFNLVPFGVGQRRGRDLSPTQHGRQDIVTLLEDVRLDGEPFSGNPFHRVLPTLELRLDVLDNHAANGLSHRGDNKSIAPLGQIQSAFCSGVIPRGWVPFKTLSPHAFLLYRLVRMNPRSAPAPSAADRRLLDRVV